MRKKDKLPPLRNNEVRILEVFTDTCMKIVHDIDEGTEVDLSQEFIRQLCLQHIHLYSRLIDANYVKRTNQPLVPFDTLH